jgi:hypothetical protein
MTVGSNTLFSASTSSGEPCMVWHEGGHAIIGRKRTQPCTACHDPQVYMPAPDVHLWRLLWHALGVCDMPVSGDLVLLCCLPAVC